MDKAFQEKDKEAIIEEIAEKIDFLPEEMKEPMILAAFFQMIQ